MLSAVTRAQVKTKSNQERRREAQWFAATTRKTILFFGACLVVATVHQGRGNEFTLVNIS